MNKTILSVVGIILVALLALFFGKKHTKQTDNTKIIVGVIAPMSGPKAKLGEGLKQAIELAQSENKETKKTVSFIFEDSSGDAAKSALGVSKLISIDKVNMLISITSQDGNIASAAATKAKIPHIGIATDPHVEKGDFNFAHYTPAPQQAVLMVSELTKRNLKKVAFLMEQNDAWVATKESFKKEIANSEVKIAYEEDFNKGTTDFRTMLSKVKEAKPDIIMMEAFSPMAEIMKTQAKELGIAIPFTSMSAHGTIKDVSGFENDWFVSGKVSSDDFQGKYEKKTGYLPPIGANYGYDITNIILAIANTDTNTDGVSLMNALENFDYKTLNSSVGTLEGLDPEGRIISQAAVLQIKNGKQVMLSQ
jgi:branched-chain amino acid transport system substrate-binding protein